ncbi:KilA-N domain-containing protein [Winogradskyella pulchriflava]|uniref:KilA-N domain-containing protein n=1 Tax=Winogradskyella pulchriflava TaxID=1110688 RepID=A0ABV6QCA4_9FLAO
MKSETNKTLEFLYQEKVIHFLVNPDEENVMINATEMAKLFNKRTDNYLQLKTTKLFLKELKVPEMSGTLNTESHHKLTDIPVQIIDNRGRNGIFFCEDLAIDFAMWLDVKFRVWVARKIRQSLKAEYQKRSKVLEKKTESQIELEKLQAELDEELKSSEKYKRIQELKKEQASCNKKLKELDNEIISRQLNLFTIN